MKVFITGGTGFIGSHVLPLLKRDGHSIIALCRTEEAAKSLREQGVEPLIGSLQDLDKLAEGAKAADAVIHLAFSHDDFSNRGSAVRIDLAALNAFHQALAGTGKIFIGTSVTTNVGDTQGKPVDESSPAVFGQRAEAEKIVLSWKNDCIKAMTMKLPPFVYGDNGFGFVGFYIDTAKKEKVVYYIDDGSKKTSSVHVADVAEGFVLGLTNGQSGAAYHLTNPAFLSFKELADAIGNLLHLEVKSVPLGDEANRYFILAFAFSMENQALPVRAEKELGWKISGKHAGVLEDIVTGSYKVRA